MDLHTEPSANRSPRPRESVPAVIAEIGRKGDLPAAARAIQRLHLIRQGHGRSGANPDYVLSTVAELERLGCRDAELHALAERLRGAGHTSPLPPGNGTEGPGAGGNSA